MAWLRAGATGFPVPAMPALAVTSLSSAGSTATLSTDVFQPGTRLVSITSIGASFYFLMGSTATTVPSSTNSAVVPAGTTRMFGISTQAGINRLIGWSS